MSISLLSNPKFEAVVKEGMDTVHSFEEVKNHSSKSDCWIIISGKVYDVTPFLEEHPGGDEALINVTGKDATEDFEDVGHSYVAQELMAKFCIGTIDSSTISAKQAPPPPAKVAAVAPPPKQSSGSLGTILMILIPMLILGLALAYQKFGKQD